MKFKKYLIFVIIIILMLSISFPTLAKYVLRDSTKKTLSVPKVSLSETTEAYNYTGSYQTFTAPKTGEYFIQLWGASGGGDHPGNGGYTSGYIHLNVGEKLYIYVGSRGAISKNEDAGYNGGGAGGKGNIDSVINGYGGGGATDVRLVSGDWNNSDGLKSRIMVASGGGGGYGWDNGGSGGGLTGYNTSGNKLDSVASQTTTSFGIGQKGGDATQWGSGGAEGNCGGGGGYYGGTSSTKTGDDSNAGGGGGSSFISGHNGCNAIDKDGNNISNSVHYSGKYFYNTTMIDGDGYSWTTSKGNQVGIPNSDATNTKDGFAKISYYGSASGPDPEPDPDPGVKTEFLFNYTGSSQTFTVPSTGRYLIELWGASGGGDYAGNGAYTSGYINLTEGTNLYIFVGSQGGEGTKSVIGTPGYNGGGSGGRACSNSVINGHGGGGATDVRLVNGNWNDTTGLRSRIMVAAGGGGGYDMDAGGAAGGLTGYNTADNKIEVATQTATSFGIGQTGGSKTVFESFGAEGNCGGGGGYYGGGASSQTGTNSNAGGGGGSSFISGHNGCNAINQNGTHTGNSIHYSNYTFTNTKIIDGEGYNWTNVKESYVGVPSTTSSSVSAGHSGNGYAKITKIN